MKRKMRLAKYLKHRSQLLGLKTKILESQSQKRKRKRFLMDFYLVKYKNLVQFVPKLKINLKLFLILGMSR